MKEKLTDKQIVKALECCENKNIPCKDCPFNDLDCVNDLERLALDLINRKDEMLKAQASKIFLYEDVLKQKTAEIERLNAMHKEMCIGMKVLKRNAIKKFAERLKAECFSSGYYENQYHREDIDNLVAEMTEVKENV